MFVTTQWIYQKYDEMNRLCFNGELPQIIAKIDKSVKRWGYACARWVSEPGGRLHTTDFSITISNAYDSPEEVKLTTLLHEMIHIADYYYNPEYFMWRDYKGWHHRRYDAHGEIYFMPMARKLKGITGYDIAKNVTAQEKSVSTLDSNVAARLEKAKQRMIVLGYAKFTPENIQKHGFEGMMFLTASTDALAKIMGNFYRRYAPYETITAYYTNDPVIKTRYKGCRDYIKGYRMSMDEFNKKISSIDQSNISKIGEYPIASRYNESLDKKVSRILNEVISDMEGPGYCGEILAADENSCVFGMD